MWPLPAQRSPEARRLIHANYRTPFFIQALPGLFCGDRVFRPLTRRYMGEPEQDTGQLADVLFQFPDVRFIQCVSRFMVKPGIRVTA